MPRARQTVNNALYVGLQKYLLFTCGDDPCEDPALAVLDALPSVAHELLQDGHAARPLERLRAVLVVAVPAAFQKAVLVLGVDLK